MTKGNRNNNSRQRKRAAAREDAKRARLTPDPDILQPPADLYPATPPEEPPALAAPTIIESKAPPPEEPPATDEPINGEFKAPAPEQPPAPDEAMTDPTSAAAPPPALTSNPISKRSKAAGHPNPTGVLIAIDWENIRKGAQRMGLQIPAAQAAGAINSIATMFGQVRQATAFGDWNLRPQDAAAFRSSGVSAHHAPRSSAGRDQSYTSIILEVYDWLKDRPECSYIVIASGDSDYEALVQRATLHGARIIISAFSDSISRDMLAAAPFFPLEAELPVVPPPQWEPEDTAGMTRTKATLEPLVQMMEHLESTLKFVGYTRLCSQWMLDWNIARDSDEAYHILQYWQGRGVLAKHRIPKQEPHTQRILALRLERQHADVQLALTAIPA